MGIAVSTRTLARIHPSIRALRSARNNNLVSVLELDLLDGGGFVSLLHDYILLL